MAGSAQRPLPTVRRRGLLARLGPGIVSGAGNDDPSALVVSAMAGATFGYATLWTSLLSFPLIFAVQLMSSRIGRTTRQGLACRLRLHYPRWLLWTVCSALVTANVLTLGADLSAMADVTARVFGGPAPWWTVAFACGTLAVLAGLPFRFLQRVLKWLCVSVFAYIAAGLLASPDWGAALAATFVPQWHGSREYAATIVAIVGASLSPYFLFWQAAQDVENELSIPHGSPGARAPSHLDVFLGAAACKLITYFVTLTTAATLYAGGPNRIASIDQVAVILKPLAGDAAYWFFFIGIIGTGMLAIPALAASSAYAIAEALGWRASLHDGPRLAPNFYAVLIISFALALLLVALRASSVRMLFWASAVNGLVAPIAILTVLLVVRKQELPEFTWVWPLAWAAFAATVAAALMLAVA